MNNNWRKILAPLLVFTLGAIFGGGLVSIVVLHKARTFVENSPIESTRFAKRLLTRELRLDPAQRAALDPVFRDVERDFVALRLDNVPRLRRLISEAESRMRPVLRPEQQRKLERLLAAPRARWQNLVPERPPSSGGPA